MPPFCFLLSFSFDYGVFSCLQNIDQITEDGGEPPTLVGFIIFRFLHDAGCDWREPETHGWIIGLTTILVAS